MAWEGGPGPQRGLAWLLAFAPEAVGGGPLPGPCGHLPERRGEGPRLGYLYLLCELFHRKLTVIQATPAHRNQVNFVWRNATTDGPGGGLASSLLNSLNIPYFLYNAVF